MISRRSYILLLILAASLSACLVGKKYTPPPQPEGITYRDTLFKDTSQLMKWFDLYKDTALRSMIRITLDSNKDILTASSRIDEARLRTAVIKANLWPKLDYSGQAGGGSAGIEAQKIASGIQGGFLNAFAVLNWELDIWGKTRHLTESAMAKYFSEVQNRNALLVSLVAEVASDYFILRDLDKRLQISR
jgi:multidrug efflux system outer membrane protein